MECFPFPASIRMKMYECVFIERFSIKTTKERLQSLFTRKVIILLTKGRHRIDLRNRRKREPIKHFSNKRGVCDYGLHLSLPPLLPCILYIEQCC